MRLRRLDLKGITRYSEPISVDFDAIGPGLVAIAGVNGAGKTSLLESPFAALHLSFPTRPGSLYGVANGRDAQLDLAFSNGADYRALVAVDAVAQKTEAYLYKGGGAVTSGKVREFTAGVEERFGSPRLFLSACLSAQNKAGSFLDLDKRERKDLLSEILDTAGLQSLAEAARERARAADARLAELRGEVNALEAELARLGDLDVLISGARVTPLGPVLTQVLEAAREGARKTEEALAQAREEYAAAREALAVAKAAQEASNKLSAQLGQARKDLNLVDVRARSAKEAHEAECSQADAEISKARELAEKVDDYRQGEKDLADAQAAKDALEAELEAARSAVATAAKEAEGARAHSRRADQLQKDLSRAKEEASLLETVPCRGEGTFSGCGFLAKAAKAKLSVATLEEELSEAMRLADTLHEKACALEKAEDQVKALKGRIEAASREISGLQALVRLLPAAEQAQARIADLEARKVDSEKTLRARLEELEADRTNLSHRVESLQADLAASGEDAVSEAEGKLEEAADKGKALKAKLDALNQSVSKHEADLARLEANRERAEEVSGSLTRARAQAEVSGRECYEWETLERALGRDGIQALEIDAAGPELSALTNDLLTSCFGERFTVNFVTQVPKADGKGTKEVFDVQVTDAERGREGSVDSLSGGEKTIVSEAISLALAIYTGRHGGNRFETLFRDETAGQLDPDNAHRYVRMLRKAREVGGFHQVVFIAQQPEVWQQADAVLWCEDGKVEVRS